MREVAAIAAEAESQVLEDELSALFETLSQNDGSVSVLVKMKAEKRMNKARVEAEACRAKAEMLMNRFVVETEHFEGTADLEHQERVAQEQAVLAERVATLTEELETEEKQLEELL